MSLPDIDRSSFGISMDSRGYVRGAPELLAPVASSEGLIFFEKKSFFGDLTLSPYSWNDPYYVTDIDATRINRLAIWFDERSSSVFAATIALKATEDHVIAAASIPAIDFYTLIDPKLATVAAPSNTTNAARVNPFATSFNKQGSPDAFRAIQEIVEAKFRPGNKPTLPLLASMVPR